MKVNIKYPEQEFFAVVSGIDVKKLSREEFIELDTIFNTCGVTVIKDQEVNDDQQIEFSKRFGELEISIGTNTKKENNAFLKPQISRISNVDVRTNEMMPVDDHKVVFDRGNNVWHSDSSFKKIPAKFSILSALAKKYF